MKKLIVNLTDDGRYVNSDAHINKKKVRPLYWFFEPLGSNNSGLDSVPKANRAGFGPNSAARGMYMTDENGVCKHRRFRLSVCGLDRFRVMVSADRAGNEPQTDETYEVWRRIYFSVRYMNAIFLFPFGPVHDEYHQHGIWPVEISPRGGARVRYQKILETREDGLNLAQGVTQPHLEGRIILVDRLWIAGARGLRGSTRRATATQTYPHDVWPDGEFITGTVNGRDIRRFATRSGNSVQYDFTSSNTLMRTLNSGGSLSIDARVKLLTKVLNGVAQSTTGRIVISSRTGISDTFRGIAPRQGTMIHEMGHGLGMVLQNIVRYDAASGNVVSQTNNPTHYSNGGGHCSTGASGSTPNFVRGTCVMYHAGHSGRPLAFCASCAPIVKRADLTRSRMRWP